MASLGALPSITEPVVDRLRQWNPVWYRWIQPLLKTVVTTANTLQTVTETVDQINGKWTIAVNDDKRARAFITIDGSQPEVVMGFLANAFFFYNPDTDGQIQVLSQQQVNGVSTWAFTGNLFADNIIAARNIAADAVTANKIAAGAIVVGKIGAGAVQTTTIENGAITTDKVGANAIVAGKIATAAVTATKILAGAVIAEKIATDAVIASKIQAGAVTADKISVSSLTAITAAFGNATVSGILKSANNKMTLNFTAGSITITN